MINSSLEKNILVRHVLNVKLVIKYKVSIVLLSMTCIIKVREN